MYNTLLLTAGDTASTINLVMLMALCIGMWVLLFLPQKKQQKKDNKMRAGLDVGDEILTQGGILGRVVSLKDDTIIIETGTDRTKLRITRTAIVGNLTTKN